LNDIQHIAHTKVNVGWAIIYSCGPYSTVKQDTRSVLVNFWIASVYNFLVVWWLQGIFGRSWPFFAAEQSLYQLFPMLKPKIWPRRQIFQRSGGMEGSKIQTKTSHENSAVEAALATTTAVVMVVGIPVQ
jgi:hypothetical protein